MPALYQISFGLSAGKTRVNISSYTKAVEELRSNEGQWSAYQSNGNCVIMAGPGSGKTKTIIVKIARLLHEEIKRPRRVACITYSNACVSELLSRLRSLDIEDDDRLLLSTVHSFCLTELVMPYARLAGMDVPDPMMVCSPSQSRECFRQAYAKALGGVPPNWFRMECDRLRRTIPDRASKEWKQSSTRETSTLEIYESILLAKGVIDFDGIILTGLTLVEKHDWVRRSIKAKYPVIVIDEYQDLGLPLHRMVLALLDSAGIRIIAVGDPDQSIYGFTGARPRLLKALEKIPKIEPIHLKLNYRCADQIITASKTLLSEPPDYRSYDGSQGEIRIYKLECNVRCQADYAFGTIVPEMLRQNPTWKPGDIALLYRSLTEGIQIAESADAHNLLYFRLDNGSPIKHTRLVEWLTEAAKWCSGGWRTGSVSLAHLLKLWRLMRRSFNNEADIFEERARLVSTLFTFRDASITLNEWLLVLRKNFIGQALDEEPGMADEKDIFEELSKASGKGGPLQSYSLKIFGNQGKSPDQINLMTLHSSKGLEFQAVIMIGLEGGVFPSNLDRTQEQLDEAKRLFYVGITRAKRLIHLVYGYKESPMIAMIRQATTNT